ncbi:uncharacterized protein LOC126298329 [Schistocerca gregaria]|uniref:uncharacterized protein LOC126298329 n=1 Tax=Schistocerca gregaria TaxID=7010 RepID=UPI00211DC726|nr:uncharacterized protein LOC126298329 [Schistocerca gregaria]
MKTKRFQWAKQLQEWTSEGWAKVCGMICNLVHMVQICFSGESVCTVMEESSQYVHHRPEEQFKAECVQQCVKHPTSVMAWSVMSLKVPGRVHTIEGTMRQEQYKEILERKLFHQINEWFPHKDTIFIHDGAPWNSPDMNPIENVCTVVKQRIWTFTITTKQNLMEKLEEI